LDINEREGEGSPLSGRAWRFANCDFDESRRQLFVDGHPVDLESKPFDVLYQLLLHAGEVVSKDELLESVWPGVAVVEGSLATAVSKLRKALGDNTQSVVLTVPRIGYRIGIPVRPQRASPPAQPELGYKVGDLVPRRAQWVMIRKLDVSLSSEVWLTEHSKTGERRVFKFAADGVRLRGLKREVTLARLLSESFGDGRHFVRVLEWNFDTLPYRLESEYGGADLNEWAEAQGGLRAISAATRLQILVDVAKAVAAAHEIGVLHRDLKPANILVSPKHAGSHDLPNDLAPNDGGWHVRVADFGSGALLEPARLSRLGITNLGFSGGENAESSLLTGTLIYMAPEVLEGRPPTALADVYALGVLLYQLVVGDFRKPLAPGWEADVSDPLLREDIAEAACGDPRRRLITAALLVNRLETNDKRRMVRKELEAERARAWQAEQRLARVRAQRPWAIAAVLGLAAGLVTALILYQNAARERNRASRQTAIAVSMNHFLASDLLGRSDPFQSGMSGETLLEAVRAASPDIDRQFRQEPEVAARLHQAVARSFDNRSDYSHARPEYEKAAALFASAGGALAGQQTLVQLQQAAMEARSYQEGSLPRARSLLAQAETGVPQLTELPIELPVWLASAKGMIALITNDAKQAAEMFQVAYDESKRMPSFNETDRLTFKQRVAFANVRLGNGARAERLFRELIEEFTRLQGADNPNVLRMRLNLAQAFMIQSRHKEAVAETTAIYPKYVERLGEDHELAIQVLSTRAESEGASGQWEAVVRDDLKVRELAVRKQGPLSFFAISAQSDAALAMCRAGHLDEGSRNAEQAWQSSTKAFGARAGLTGGAAHTLASCWIEMGKLAEAWALLQGIDVSAVTQLAGLKDWGANVELSEAEIAWRRGDPATARRLLKAAASVFSRDDAEPYQRHSLEKLQAALEPVAARE
jgi:DNA-binding winged helix-turn-helix (wHTH) protein/serine/threonine protein kinase